MIAKPTEPRPRRPSPSSRSRARFSRIALFALGVALAAPADAQQPQGSILHEFVPPDPNEDVSFATTTLEGDLPAAIQTPSASPPRPTREGPLARTRVQRRHHGRQPRLLLRADRDTRRPHVENYDDPFSPATAPFKRLRAYDWVDPDYSLHVRDKSLKPIPVGGTLGPGDEPFYGDMSVDLLPGQPVRIPTVGPGARILRLHTNPEVAVDAFRDGADNWFVRGAIGSASAW